MYGYGVDSAFWLKFFLFMLVLSLVMFLFGVVARRMLKVKRKKLFSHNHLNDTHKKIDWTIRITFIVAIIIGGIINISRFPLRPILYLEPYFLGILLVYLSEIVRAVMEWKHAENRNDYIFTIAQLIFITFILIILFTTRFFGLLV